MNWLLWLLVSVLGQTAITLAIARPMYRSGRIRQAEKLAAWQVKRDQYYIERPSIATETEDFAAALLSGFFWPITALVFAVVGACKGLRKVVTAGVPSIKEMNQR